VRHAHLADATPFEAELDQQLGREEGATRLHPDRLQGRALE